MLSYIQYPLPPNGFYPRVPRFILASEAALSRKMDLCRLMGIAVWA